MENDCQLFNLPLKKVGIQLANIRGKRWGNEKLTAT
jgi:hypothetical protein